MIALQASSVRIGGLSGTFEVPTKPVYLDNHATTRTDPRVVEAILPFFAEIYGNPSSRSHVFGWEAADAVDRARQQVAALIGVESREIFFTSGATESNNLAIKGVVAGLKSRGNHLLTAAIEHRAVLDPFKRLAREGWDLTLIRPDTHGLISAEAVASALTDRTVLVSIMTANNEVGTINPVGEIGSLCRSRGIVFHTDASQAVGKMALSVRETHVDLLSLSGHKFHAPKGIGALFVNREAARLRLTPLCDGGGQERGLRPGTLSVPLIVGLGVAAEIARLEQIDESARLRRLRDRLQVALVTSIDGVKVHGHPTLRLPNNLNIGFEGIDGDALLMAIREVAVSSGSACSTANPEPSHVLKALGVADDLARASLRFGLGRFTTAEDVDFAASHVCDAVHRLRRLHPSLSETQG